MNIKVSRTNVTVNQLYKRVRAELVDYGAPRIFWHLGHPFAPMLRTAPYLEVRD